MGIEELQNNFQYLVGTTDFSKALSNYVGAEYFASDVLGFEEYEEGEEEGGDEVAPDQTQNRTGGLAGIQNEVIPEEDGF